CCICNHPGWDCCRIIKKWCFEKIQKRGAVNLVEKKRHGEQLSQHSAFYAIILKVKNWRYKGIEEEQVTIQIRSRSNHVD
ncbi:unnamed protein product, partial [Rangifer tarandus platyrhynchus]